MGLRPFSRHSKESAEETPSNGSNDVAPFFSTALRPADAAAEAVRPNQVPAQEVPTVVLEEHGGAGWYPDATDPGLMRYWDGFHLTGQVMHVHARAGEAEAAAPATAAVEADDSSVNAEPPASDAPAAGTRVTDVRATDLLAPFPSQFVALDEPGPFGGGGRSVEQPPSSVPAAPVADASSADVVASVDSDDSPPARSEDIGESGAGVSGGGQAEVGDEGEGTGNDLAVAGFKNSDRRQESAFSSIDSLARPSSQGGADRAGNWAEEAERAVQKAKELGTPQAWQEAAEVAAVVSEMAQIMRVAAEATRVADQMGRSAKDAAQRADLAAQKASDANQSAQRTAKAAREAAEEAKMADEAAVAAKQAAEQTAEAAPKLAEQAKVAAQTAAEADGKARGLEAIVAKACNSNTPAAWSEALRLSSEATESGE
jgi:hypothetical protein